MLCYWAYVKEDVQIGTVVKGISTGGCLLGVAILCVRKAQVLSDSYTLVSECEQVRNELEKPKMAYMVYKQAVEDTLPEKKKMLYVVDHELSLYNSLHMLKRKDD